MKDYHVNIFWTDEDGRQIADIPDLGACSAFGSTAEEALREVEIAKAAWMEAARAEGPPSPNLAIAPRSTTPRDDLRLREPCRQDDSREDHAPTPDGRHTDQQIDHLIYVLYSLTNDEIKIVERAAAR